MKSASNLGLIKVSAMRIEDAGDQVRLPERISGETESIAEEETSANFLRTRGLNPEFG
jgi:hypothetical protein